MTASEPASIQTYGGWRRVRGIGLFGLGQAASAAVVGAIVVPLFTLSVSVRLFLAELPAATTVCLLAVVQRDGEPIAAIGLRRARWWSGRAQAYQTFRSAAVDDLGGLPGPLAPLRLLQVEDGVGGHFGLVWDQQTGYLTASFRCSAQSTWLVDDAQADGWVSSWHHWLARLGYHPTVMWVSVGVDSAPEPGSALAQYVAGRLSPGAPAYAREVMAELVRVSPDATAEVRTWVAITFDPAAALERLDSILDQAAEVSRLLIGFEAGLRGCGVASVARAQAHELAGAVRTAFDPGSRGEVQRLLAGPAVVARDVLTWDVAGPVGHEEAWDRYLHDSGVSVSWSWTEAPRQQVTSAVLSRLMAPGRYARRVSLLYRAEPAAKAAQILDDQVNAARFRAEVQRRAGRDATARDSADLDQARRAAEEEAQGAGVVKLCVYVTVTAPSADLLPAAVTETEHRAGESKIRLRREYGGQLAALCATLPIGVHPVSLATRGRR